MAAVGQLTISLLGPVLVSIDGHVAPLRSKPQRIVLARLALEPDRVVSSTTLIDALWPDEPPDNAAGNLHSYVSKLRRVVGSDRIIGEHSGYRLRVSDDAVDAHRAERLANSITDRSDAEERAETLSQALSLWRGEPLADLDDVPALIPERIRLSALHRELEVRQMAAQVQAGQHARVLPALKDAAARDPHDETILRLLIRTLHGLGRTREALRTATEFRHRIAEEAGLDASAELARLEQRILADDAELRITSAEPRPQEVEVEQEPPTASWPSTGTPLHGRQAELQRLEALLVTEQVLSLTGPGGIGKTRLALTLADRRRSRGQDVHVLPLAALTSEDDLAATLAAALGMRVPAGHDPSARVHERLTGTGQLLILDNCEHVLEGVRNLVETLLSSASDLTVLTTSRAPLGVPTERVVRVPTLDPAGEAARRLFVERAQRVRAGWQLADADVETLQALISSLGGLPLAIELAAGRMASMSLTDLAARVDDLDLLADGRSTERHRTVRATIDWSYRLLSEPSRQLLRALSAFPAGVDLTTVEDLAEPLGLPGGGRTELVALVDASLVDAELGPTSWYSMLEPVRAFADEHLHSAGEHGTAIALRASRQREVAAWIDETARGPQEAVADARLRRELPNLRAAHRTALREDDLGTAIAISAGLMRAATSRDLPEIWSWALDLAAHPAVRHHPEGSDALGAAAEAAWLTGDLDLGEALAQEGMTLDPASVPCRHALASISLFRGRPDLARQLWLEAGQRNGLPQAGLAAAYQGDADGALAILAEASTWASSGGSPTDLAVCRYATGELLGPELAALQQYRDAMTLAHSVGSTFVAAISRVGLASTLAMNHRYREAIEEFETVIQYWRRTGNWTQQWTTLRNVADLLEMLSRSTMANRIRTAAASAPSAPAPEGETGVIATGDISHPEAPATLVADVLAELAGAQEDGRTR